MLLIKRPVDIIIRVYRRPNITMLYPQVTGHENVNAIALMNLKIRNAVMELIKSLDQPDLKTTIDGSFEIKNNQRGVLSILLIGMADFGGAHPMTVTKSLTMDTGTGEDYSLNQLFNPGYMDIINAEIRRQIKERDIPILDSFKGISPDQDYYVSDHTIVIYYQLYELSPYAAGFPYFPIPLYMLSNVIPDNGLLDRLNYF
ncbi:MAG TPA: DUF3298 domain-containing protein [Thermoclostridium sp.]